MTAFVIDICILCFTEPLTQARLKNYIFCFYFSYIELNFNLREFLFWVFSCKFITVLPIYIISKFFPPKFPTLIFWVVSHNITPFSVIYIFFNTMALIRCHRGDPYKCLVLSTLQSKPQIYSIYQDRRLYKPPNNLIWEAGTTTFLEFLLFCFSHKSFGPFMLHYDMYD